jgi:nickel-dependent lactate racemase
MVAGYGSLHADLREQEVMEILAEGLTSDFITGKRILVLTPDATRTAPLPMMIRSVHDILNRYAKRVDYMVALGTHRPLSDREIDTLYGITKAERNIQFSNSDFLNHQWGKPDAFKTIGKVSEYDIETITGGLFQEEVEITINRAIFDYDLIIILGPVFPHEIVGFSGGYKYLFPGISGGEFLHFFHWLGAVITCMEVIGKKYTPIHELLIRAARFMPVQTFCISMVVTAENRLAGLYTGDIDESWEAAADLSSRLHIVYKKNPFNLVIGRAAGMYGELWTAGKVMYKLEPVVSDGGTLIIYGSHVKRISHTWGKEIERIGYHVRDYFLSRMDSFRHVPRAVLAHSTHVKGVGIYENGAERPRIQVVLATDIPEKLCRKINLGYMNPTDIDPDAYRNREHEGVLYVEDAGEMLYRLDDGVGHGFG